MKFWLRHGSLMEEAGDGAAGGGGPLTEEQIKRLITDVVNGTVNGAIKAVKTDVDKALGAKLTKLEEAIAALSKTGNGEGAGESDVDGEKKLDPKIASKLHDLETKQAKALSALEEMSKKAAQAELKADEADRRAQFQSAISSLEFRDEEMREAFTSRYFAQMARTEDGTLVIGDLPAIDAIKAIAEKSPSYFAPRGGGGSGARTGAPAGAAKFTTEGIKPNMTDAERRAYLKHIGTAMGRN